MRPRSDERGAVAILTAAVMVVVLGVAALVVDIGTQRVSRRDMQALADVVALDLARMLNGRTAAQVRSGSTGFSGLTAAKDASVARNDDFVVGKAGSVGVTPYLVKLDAAGSYATGVDGLPIEVLSTAVPTAVVVVATTEVSFGFASAIGVSSGSVTRSAVAAAQSSACFTMGSYAAAIDSQGSSVLGPLNGLLGLNLALVSYQGLANASVSIAELAAQTTLGSVDQILSGTVTVGQLTAATIKVLQNQDATGNAAAITALQAVQAAANLNQPVQIGDVVAIQQGDSAALLSQLNVLDLVSGTILAADGNHALSTSGLNVVGITGDLYVTQGVQRACGVPNDPLVKATSSQVAANLTVPLAFPTGSSVLGLTVTGSARVTGGLGNAEGRLVAPPQVDCKLGTTASPDSYRVDVNGGLLGLGVKADLTLNGTVSTGLLGGLVDVLLGSLVQVTFNDVRISVGSNAPGVSATAQHADLQVPQNAYNSTPRGTPVKTGSAYGGVGTVPTITTTTVLSGTITVRTSGILGLIGAQTNTVALGYGPIGSLVTTLLGSVNGVLNNTVNNAVVPGLNNLLTPLSRLLGVNAGGADVFSVARPTCNGSRLVG